MKLDNKIAAALLNLAKKNNVIVFILFVFLALCYGYYSSIDMGIPPDEFAHMGYIYDVVKNGFPNYSAGFIYETDKYNYLPHPALYYFITGNIAKLYHLFDVYSTRPLRIINILTSMGTLLVIYAALNKMGIRKSSIFLALIILLCIPMFILLSASINNDTLMIFGCALVTYSLVLYYYHATTRKVIGYLLLGCVITALSKATGALSMVCMISVFIIIQNVKLKKFIFNLKILDFFLIIFSISCVAIYFLIVYKHFGKLFPAPQGDPSDWFLVMNPNYPRYTLYEHLIAFYQSNMTTLLSPYGHGYIEDLQIRRILLGITLATSPILIIASLYKESYKCSPKWKLLTIFISSFIIFAIFYFHTVRSMNLRTGYTGAMQARYFFGFLPALVIVYAILIEKITINTLRTPLIIFLISLLAFSFYPSYSSLRQEFYGQSLSNTTSGELTKDREFRQNFVAKYNKINKVQLLFGTYQNKNNSTGEVSLKIVDSQNHTLTQKDIKLSDITDNTWVSFDFVTTPLTVGQTYRLVLTSSNIAPGNAVTWWALKPQIINPQFVGTHYGPHEDPIQLYQDGQAYIDGQPVQKSFSFKIYHN